MKSQYYFNGYNYNGKPYCDDCYLCLAENYNDVFAKGHMIIIDSKDDRQKTAMPQCYTCKKEIPLMFTCTIAFKGIMKIALLDITQSDLHNGLLYYVIALAREKGFLVIN